MDIGHLLCVYNIATYGGTIVLNTTLGTLLLCAVLYAHDDATEEAAHKYLLDNYLSKMN